MNKAPIVAVIAILFSAFGAAQTTFTGIINDTNVSYDARSSGVVADGITDDSAHINSAIAFANANHYGIVQLPCGLIKVNQAINLTNFSGLTLRGCGSTSAVNVNAGTGTNLPWQTNDVTALMCNTGNVCIDRTGSSRVVLKDFNIATLASYTNPSVVGVLDGRDNSGGGGSANPFCFDQFNQIDNLFINMHHNQAVNSNNGTIAILDITGEHYSIANSRVLADTGLAFFNANLVGAASPYQTLETGCPSSMTIVTVVNTSVGFLGTSGGSPVQMAGVANVKFINVHVQGSSLGGSAFSIGGQAGSSNVYIQAQVENFAPVNYGTVLLLNQSIDHLELNASTAGTVSGSGAWIGSQIGGFAVSNSRLRVQPTDGTQNLQLIQSAGMTYTGTVMDMYTGNSAPSVTLLGCIIFAPTVPDSSFAFSPSSQYMLMDANGNSFQGSLHVNGSLSKSAGSFRIDHPLDPAHKYLAHSFVESPDMMSIYNGIVFLDSKGQATIKLPAYFEALNRDFRYQLTPIGGYGEVYVSREIKNNSFSIAGGKAGMKVSWQVTGIRHDPYAEKHRIVVEEEKKMLNLDDSASRPKTLSGAN